MANPDRDEQDVAEALTSYFAVGDDRIATGHGLATLHPIHRARNLLLATVGQGDGERAIDYEVTITVRRIR
jgi:hypothetical protein